MRYRVLETQLQQDSGTHHNSKQRQRKANRLSFAAVLSGYIPSLMLSTTIESLKKVKKEQGVSISQIMDLLDEKGKNVSEAT